jgi:hypothetical protein
LLGGAAALGAYAGIGRIDVGPSVQAETVPAVQLAARSARLDAMEADLSKALAKKPPRLPKVPKYPKVKVPAPAPAPASAPRIVQVASAPVARSSSGGSGSGSRRYEHDDDEHEHEGGDD